MRGFRSRTDVADVWQLIDDGIHALPPEPVPILETAGRVLAQAAVSMVDVPAFRRSAMDGYAVIAEETFGATPDDPRPLRIVGRSHPARPADVDVTAGTAVRIMTGAPVPPGADAVVPVEQTRLEDQLEDQTVLVAAPVTPKQNVGAVGEDVAKGTTVLHAGRRLRPQDVGLLSSIGFAQVFCVRSPRVAVLVTGNELLPPGSMPDGYRIVDSNTPMLLPLVRRDGGEPHPGTIVADTHEAVRNALLAAVKGADCVLVCGGSSVGEEDYVPQVLREDGILPVHGVAMRPSSPSGVGFLDRTPVFLLPGNPVSCLCAYDFFAGRAIRRLAGLPSYWPHTTARVPLSRKIASVLGRTDYVRVRILKEGKVEPLAVRGAAILSSTTRAHGFVVVDRDAEGHAEGETVSVHLY